MKSAQLNLVASAVLLLVVSISTGCGSMVEKTNAQVNVETVCTIATLNGTYGFQRNGQTLQGPLLAIGIATLDGQGTTSAQQTISRSGTFNTPAAQIGPYTVNPDCMGTLIDANGNVFAQFVVVHDGNEVLGMSLTPGNNVAIHYERLVDR